MKLSKVQTILEAEVIYGNEWAEREVLNACSADLMSDVLTFAEDKTILITGLNNVQVVRTADVSDITAIIFARGKRPNPEVIELAEQKNIPLLTTPFTMYEACGLLYYNGLRNGQPKDDDCG